MGLGDLRQFKPVHPPCAGTSVDSTEEDAELTVHPHLRGDIL